MRSPQSDGAGARASWIDPQVARQALENLGFKATADLPDRPGPALLLVAIRPRPTLRHFDPERIRFWVTEEQRGRAREITYGTGMPIRATYSWGLIRIIDRLSVSNEYLSFGGQLTAERFGEVVSAIFESPAPILRRGGHSQGWDHGAEAVGAFFARLMLAVDYVPGFEGRLAAAEPLERFSAFVADAVTRFEATPQLCQQHPDLWALLSAERRHLCLDNAATWAEGQVLLEMMRLQQA